MIPELEVLFFDVPETIESQLGHELTEEQRMAGSFAPKKVFAKRLGEHELEALRGCTEVKRIRDFV